jgi:UDP-glucose 4-epimerase
MKAVMTSKTVALTGASSFTGVWIAHALSQAGYSVQAILSSTENSYTGLKATRVKFLLQHATPHYGVRAEDGSMAKWIEAHSPSVWVHHHHFMENFRGPDYDTQKSTAIGIKPLTKIIEALSRKGCSGIIYSGTYFEDYASTPYALSKKEVWNHLLAETEKVHLPLSKVIIANPIGPFENEDRMIPIMVKKARAGETVKLTAPQAVGDQVSVWDLAKAYVSAADALFTGGEAKILSPSGSVESVLDFVNRVNQGLIQKELGLAPCTLEIANNAANPTRFENPASERKPIDWPVFWKEYARSVRDMGYTF